MSTVSLDWFREYLIATSYGQAVTQLSILKYVLRLERSTVSATSNRCLTAASSIPTSASSSSSSFSRNSTKSKLRPLNEVQPSETVLYAIKLERELKNLIELYTLACEALTESQIDASGFKQAIEQSIQSNNKETHLQQELKANKLELKSLKLQIEHQREEGLQRLVSSSERIAELRHKLKHVRQINDLEFDLVIKWEQSRCDQATIVCEKQENALIQQSALLRRKIDGECRVICEVETFYQLQMKSLEQKINEWQQKYDNELNKWNGLIAEKQKRIFKLKRTYESHKEIYDERVKLVQEYQQQKAEELRLIELQQKRVESAIRIQAWWRGTMVRKGLGPFKKKSKKGRKPKKK